MDLSLNEVAAQVRKATRGAGYSWGEAEEAGKAARWLCRHGLDGCRVIAEVLQDDEVNEHTLGRCPIKAGLLLSDTATQLQSSPATFIGLTNPILLLAFAANASSVISKPIRVKAEGWAATISGEAVELAGDVFGRTKELTVSLHGTEPRSSKTYERANPDPDVWKILSNFAHRTYAPSTAQSRLSGAGAGLSDAD